MIINTELEYKTALSRIEELWSSDPYTSDGKMLETLVSSIETYEKKYFPIDPPDGVEAIKFRKEQEV